MKSNRKQLSVQKLCISALMTAVVCATTAAVQIPIPLGYMHLGNVAILIAGICFGPVVGALAGGIGSALADLLTGFAVWAVPTLVIKCAMGYAIGRIAWAGKASFPKNQLRIALANIAGIAIMVAGYTIFGAVIYGSLAAGLSQVPGLTLEGVLAIVVFYAFFAALSAAKMTKLFSGFGG